MRWKNNVVENPIKYGLRNTVEVKHKIEITLEREMFEG